MKHPPRKAKGQTPVRDWYTLPEAELIARRREVWGLLRWYHETWVVPHRGLRGFVGRLRARISGDRAFLMSPWEQLDLKLAALAVAAEAEARVGSETAPTSALSPAESNGTH